MLKSCSFLDVEKLLESKDDSLFICYEIYDYAMIFVIRKSYYKLIFRHFIHHFKIMFLKYNFN